MSCIWDLAKDVGDDDHHHHHYHPIDDDRHNPIIITLTTITVLFLKPGKESRYRILKREGLLESFCSTNIFQ